MISEWRWTKVSEWPWSLVPMQLHILTWLHIPSLSSQATIVFRKINNFYFLPYKSISDQNWPRCEIGQGQLRVIVKQIMMGLRPQYYIPSFKAIDSRVPQKKTFEGILTYMVMAAILVVWPGLWTNLCSPIPGRLHMKLISAGPVVSKEKMFENVDRRQTATTEPTLTISSPVSQGLRGA